MARSFSDVNIQLMRVRTALRCFSQAHRPIRAELGQIERYDCEYRRNGTANLFVFLEKRLPKQSKSLCRGTSTGLRTRFAIELMLERAVCASDCAMRRCSPRPTRATPGRSTCTRERE